MKPKVLLCNFLIISLTGCSSHLIDTSEDIIGYQSQKKGILIIQGAYVEKEKTEKFILHSYWLNKNRSRFLDINPATFIKYTPLSIFLPDNTSHNETMILFVEPGNYTLENIRFQNKIANNLNNFINFSVKGGEVVYVGKLTFDYKSIIIAKSLDIQDCYKSACEDFKKSYPQINVIPKKRLMEFGPQIQLFKSLDQHFRIIDHTNE